MSESKAGETLMAGIVHAFNPAPAAYLDSAQGQSLEPLWWGGPDGNIPDSPTCGVKILMTPRKVSKPHIHREVQVHVTQITGLPVLTLYGDALENAVWLVPGGTLLIQPGVPHVALYPQRGSREDALDAIAVEVRNTPDWQYDVEPLPELWPVAFNRASQADIAHLLEWPDGVI